VGLFPGVFAADDVEESSRGCHPAVGPGGLQGLGQLVAPGPVPPRDGANLPGKSRQQRSSDALDLYG